MRKAVCEKLKSDLAILVETNRHLDDILKNITKSDDFLLEQAIVLRKNIKIGLDELGRTWEQIQMSQIVGNKEAKQSLGAFFKR